MLSDPSPGCVTKSGSLTSLRLYLFMQWTTEKITQQIVSNPEKVTGDRCGFLVLFLSHGPARPSCWTSWPCLG